MWLPKLGSGFQTLDGGIECPDQHKREGQRRWQQREFTDQELPIGGAEWQVLALAEREQLVFAKLGG